MVDIGILLPTRGAIIASPENPDLSPVFEMARLAERYGYDSLWVGDSLVARPRLEALTMLAALAMVTQRPKLGTAVYLPAQRHPLQLAQALATADILSRGRLIWGVGVGSGVPDYYFEWEALGVPPKQRASRLEETIEIIKRLWTGEPLTYEGRYYRFDNIRMLPRPLQKSGVPVWFATGHGRFVERQHERVVRWGDGAMFNLDYPNEVRRLKQTILELAEREGRDPASLHFAMYMSIHLDPDPAKAAREGEEWLVKYYWRNWWGDRWGPFGPADAIIQRLHEYLEAGVQSFVIRFAAYEQLTQLERFTEQVLPEFRR